MQNAISPAKDSSLFDIEISLTAQKEKREEESIYLIVLLDK